MQDQPSMTLRLFNTLSGQVEPLVPSDGTTLRMYACGPTVYDFGHIGNFRTFLAVDILRRFLLLTGVHIRHVMNITDVTTRSFATLRRRVFRFANTQRPLRRRS